MEHPGRGRETRREGAHMNLKRRNPFILTILALSGLILSAAPRPAQAERVSVTLPPARGGAPVTVRQEEGRYLAVYLLSEGDRPIQEPRLHEFARLGPTLAGVQYLFIKLGEPEQAKKLAGALGDGARLLADPSGGSAERFGVAMALPHDALIILDPEGREIERLGGTSGPPPTFQEFKEAFTKLTADPALPQFNLGPDKVALKGFDPVAYFTERKAVKGDAGRQASWRGAVYQFATAENQARFSAAPEKYLPAYGGWSAAAMARGEKADIDPERFAVTGGRLYLFDRKTPEAAIREWGQGGGEAVKQADERWSKLSSAPPAQAAPTPAAQ